MTDCIFCKMVSGEIRPRVAYEDDEVFAFHDVNPQAPVHVLVIPRRHVATLNDASDEDAALLGRLVLAARRLASELGVNESGYRTVINCNADAGQSVFHVHLHLLGGRPMDWPPG